MKLSCKVKEDFTLQNVAFTDCTGLERVNNVKEALGVLRLENPAVAFVEAAKEGRFNDMSDEDYQGLLSTFKCISNLFRYPDDPADAKAQSKMNVLVLLANAIQELTRLNMILETCGVKS